MAETERHHFNSWRYGWPSQHRVAPLGTAVLVETISQVPFARPVQISLFAGAENGVRETFTSLLGPLFRQHRPDIAIVRLIGADALPENRLSLVDGVILLAIGRSQFHELIPLQGNYEDFLSSLGKRTRRNVRAALRQIDDAEIAFFSRKASRPACPTTSLSWLPTICRCRLRSPRSAPTMLW